MKTIVIRDTFGLRRTYFALVAVSMACAGCAGVGDRIVESKVSGHTVALRAGVLKGIVADNVANAKGQGAGFHPLYYTAYPKAPIFRPELVGLNFEHIFNGVAADKDRCMFTPRKDPCILARHASRRASLRWDADSTAWRMDATLTYTLAEPNAIDIVFETTPRAPMFPLGYCAMMWASYMNRTRERRIHFVGPDGWTTFGDDLDKGFETGTVACAGVPDLPYEEGAQTLNLIEHPTKKFTLPFYYGLIDGDNDLETRDDTMAYIVMFDQTESIRFALWNFIPDANRLPDPHSPAWDWQFVIRDPQPGTAYGYRARVLIKPFVSPDDVRREYDAWRARL